MTWKSGESGNPKGRPVKRRALTAALESTFGNGSKKKLALKVKDLLLTGKVTLEDSDGTVRVIEANIDDWIGAMQFLYKHIDGPPPASLELSGPDGGPIETLDAGADLTRYTDEELAQLRTINEAADARRDQERAG